MATAQRKGSAAGTNPRLCAAAAILVVLASYAAPARAGSDPVLLGDDASLLGGAVTAIVNDGSALWYNPAGLAHASRNTIDFNLSAYTLRLYRVPDAIVSLSGASASADVTEVVVIPASVSYVRTTKKGLRIGLGVFTTALADYSQTAELVFSDLTTGFDWEWLVSLSNRITVYHGVLGVGWSANERLHFGVTADVSYVSVTQASQVGGGLILDQQTGQAAIAAASSARLSLTGVGLRFGAGVMWEPSDLVSLGASFQTASYVLFSSFSLQQVDAGGVAVPGEDGVVFLDTFNTSESSLEFEQFEPYRWRLGLAFHFGRTTLSLDGDVQLDQRALSNRWDVSYNARIGALFGLTEAVSFGFGLFTDRRTIREDPELFGESNPDFYGFTTGVKLTKTRMMAETEDIDSLTFETTISFRYAFGFGDFAGLLLLDDASLVEENTILVEEAITDVRVHDFSIYVGGGVRF